MQLPLVTPLVSALVEPRSHYHQLLLLLPTVISKPFKDAVTVLPSTYPYIYHTVTDMVELLSFLNMFLNGLGYRLYKARLKKMGIEVVRWRKQGRDFWIDMLDCMSYRRTLDR